MAHFEQDPNDTATDCDIDNKLANGSIWRATIALGQDRAGSVALYGAGGLTVRSNNPHVINNPIPDHTWGGYRILKLSGASTGTTMIEVGVWDAVGRSWAAGSPWVWLQVQVKEHLNVPTLPDRLISLSAPHMALNAPKISVSYTMKYTRTIPPSTSLPELAAIVNNVGHLKHLVISAHGHIVRRDDGPGIADSEIEIGTVIRRTDLDFFRAIRKSIGGGILWLGSCAIGDDTDAGRERAKAAHCHIIAPTMYMQLRPGQGSGPLPYGKMDMYPAFRPAVFDPNGNLINWPRFATTIGPRLGLRV
jgi:hypothetical protein